jgi:signal transduction histidine kinase
MKSASSVPVASSRAPWEAVPFREAHKPALDRGFFPREPRGSGEGGLDYSALLMQERKTHSAAMADRDRLLAIFSHDLKNLLHALTLNAAIVLRRSGDTAEKGASNVQAIIGRMDRMLSNLLDLARVNAGKLRVVARSGDVAEVVREAVDAFRPLAEEKHLT